mmetsp:Transcript_113874/g.322067  ORF Transcript_113874/g.322067 Transcript_113874/m.322067 type:complete len:272 (+) Transcript_113874:1440-2255(+)
MKRCDPFHKLEARLLAHRARPILDVIFWAALRNLRHRRQRLRHGHAVKGTGDVERILLRDLVGRRVTSPMVTQIAEAIDDRGLRADPESLLQRQVPALLAGALHQGPEVALGGRRGRGRRRRGRGLRGRYRGDRGRRHDGRRGGRLGDRRQSSAKGRRRWLRRVGEEIGGLGPLRRRERCNGRVELRGEQRDQAQHERCHHTGAERPAASRRGPGSRRVIVPIHAPPALVLRQRPTRASATQKPLLLFLRHRRQGAQEGGVCWSPAGTSAT